MKPKKTNKHFPDAIAVPVADGFEFLNVSQIMYCKADGNYASVYITGGKNIFVTRKLIQFEEFLVAHHFIRTHHSYLVNPDFIKKYTRGNGGYLVLKDGSTLPVARQQKTKIMKLIPKI